MSRSPATATSPAMPEEFLRITARWLVVESPVVNIALEPGDRVLVEPGQSIRPGAPIAECTLDPETVDVGKISRRNGRGRSEYEDNPPTGVEERRTPPSPGKWWTGGDERRGKPGRRERPRRLAGTLLYEFEGRWAAAAGERHDTIDSPVAGTVVEARSCIGISIKVEGVAIPGTVAGGRAARGKLEAPQLVDGELRDTALDVGRAGAIVVSGGRLSTEALTRARAMSVRGIVAGGVGHAELRDLAASEARQRAALHSMAPFGVLGLDGYQRRPIASPLLSLLSALAGREVAILTDPPMLVFEVKSISLPDLAPDTIRVRSGPNAGREGRWLGSAGLYRFRAGIHLEAAHVLLAGESAPTVVPLADLERFVL